MSRVHVSVNPPTFASRPVLASGAVRVAPDAGPSEQPVDRLLSCIAGFYGNEEQARNKAAQIQRAHGLAGAQLVLLSPRDAPRQQFSRLAKQWAGHWPAGRQSPVGGHLSTGLLALAILLLLGWGTVMWSDDPGFFSQSPALAWLGGSMGLGLVAVWLFQRKRTRPHVRRFESRVQQQLAQGHWALVVCKLSWAQQAGVLALLRAGSLRWCAVAEPSARL